MKRNILMKNKIAFIALGVALIFSACGKVASVDSHNADISPSQEQSEETDALIEEVAEERDKSSDSASAQLDKKIKESKEKNKKSKKTPSKKKKYKAKSSKTSKEELKEETEQAAKSDTRKCKDAYLEIVKSLSEKSSDFKFNLVYFDDDDTPELVADRLGCLNMYTYKNDEIKVLIDGWDYGSAGNTGYSYAQRKGLVYNCVYEYGGLIIRHRYGKLDTDTYEIQFDEGEELSVWNVGDSNGDGKIDQADVDTMEESYSGSPTYRRGSKNISEKDFEDYLKEYELLDFFGNYTFDEMLEKLGNK